MKYLIIILAVMVFCELKFDFFTKNLKKIFKLKNKDKIIVFITLTFIILFVSSFGSYQIAEYFQFKPKFVGKPIYKNFYGPYVWFRFIFIKATSQNVTLNKIYLLNTSLLCFLSIPLFLYMIKKSEENNLDTHGTARWATIAEWEEAGLMSPPGQYTDGVILGRTKRGLFGLLKPRYIIETLKTHIALIAPSRAGKGAGVIITTLLNWLGSVFVLDMKGENYQITAGYRKKVLGQKVLKFKPYGLEGSVSYNPLAEVRIGTPYEVKDAKIIADILTDPGEGKKRDHWDTSASAVFEGLILHVLYVGKKEGRLGTFGDIVAFLTSTKKPLEENILDLMTYKHLNDDECAIWDSIYDKSQLDGINRGTNPVVARMAAALLNKDERERASVISTVMAKLSLFSDPIIQKNTSRADFRIKDLMDYETPVSFYVVVEAEQMDTLAPLLRILITQMIGILAPEMDFSSDAPVHLHKLLLLMDEFPAFGTIPIFETALAYLAGYNIKALIIAQALNQIKKRYGERNSVFDNCATTVFYSPTPLDTETPKQISEMLGDKTIKVKNKSYKAFQIGSVNISESNQARRLLTPEEVRNKVAGKWNIISVTGLYPMIGVKLEYYKEKYFKSKTNKVYGIPETDYIYPHNNEKEISIDNVSKKQKLIEEEELMEKLNQKFLNEIDDENIDLGINNEEYNFEKEELSEDEKKELLFTLGEENEEGVVDPEEGF